MGSSKKQTIGYRYYMGLHFGLCHGPVDALLEIRGGDRTAWEGNITESFTINVVAPELWGGEKKEGGISGIMDVCMGEATQMPNAYLVSQLGDTVPGFRGMLSLVWNKGLIGAMNPYPKPWKFKVRRALQGWYGGTAWYPEKAEVALDTGFTLEPDATDWEYQVIPHHDDPGHENLTPPADGWSVGQGPFAGGTAVGEGNTDWPIKTILWVRRQVTVPSGRIAELQLDSENGAVVLLNGQVIGGVNRDNGPVDGNPTATFPIPAGTHTLAIKGIDEVTPAGGGTRLRAWGSLRGTGAMNPAHIAYEALTNPDWGLGYPSAVLDLASFTAAADTFHGEGLGLCLQWARQDSVEGFIQDVMNHAGAVLAQDPRTALFRLLPIRGGYDVEALPEFRRGLNVLAVENFERAAITETVNEVTVQYVDVNTGKDGSVTIQHLANIQAQGGVASQTIRYPGAPTAALAQRLALRDLTAKAQPLCKVRLIVDRSGYGILPGEVIRWTDNKLGIVDMPMRVLQVNYGNLTAGGITLDLAEDVFGLPATSYLGQQDSGWAEPSGEPQASAEVAAFEAPYVALHRTQGSSAVAGLDVDAGYLAMAAAKPAGVNYGFALYTRVGAADYEETGADDWAQGGPLTADVAPLDTVLELGSPVGLDTVSAGDLAMLGTDADAELVRVDAVDATAGTVTVGRGCGDTTPRAWPLGTRLWVIEDNVAASVTEFATGETVDAKAVTRSSGGELPLASAPTDSVTMGQRQARPYPPGLFRINGEAYPANAFGELTVTWAHRDRLLQADQLIAEGEASIGPEAGTTYTMRTYLDAVLVDTQASLVGTSATVWPVANGLARIELESQRDALTSWQMQVHEFPYTTAAPVSIDGELAKGTLYIPHRGAALRYPEHTLLAYGASVATGFPWVEIDVSALSDGALAAFHDATVDRITTSSGAVSGFNTAAFEALTIDSDTWHGGGYGNLSPVLVSTALEDLAGTAIFVVDEKAGGGGAIVAELVAAGIPTTQAIVSATDYADLTAAVAAGYPASIVATPSGASNPADAITNGVEWAAIDHLRGSTFVSDWVSAGINVVCFTVQRHYDRDAMLALGVKGFYSDDPEYLERAAPYATADNFAAQTWQPGMLAQNYKDSLASTDDGLDAAMRGRFVAPDKWGFTTDSGTNLTRSVLQGWACPIKSAPACDDFTIDLKVTFGAPGNGDQSRWAAVFVAADDRAYVSTAGGTGGPSGYLFIFRKNGTIAIYLASNNQTTDSLVAQSTTGAAIADNAEVRFKVVVTPTQVKIERLDGAGAVVQSVTGNDTTAGRRGGYFHLCHSRMPALFRDISIT